MAEGPKIIIGVDPDDEETYLVHLREPMFTARVIQDDFASPSGLTVALSGDWVLEDFQAEDIIELELSLLDASFTEELDDAVKTVLREDDE